AFDTERLIQDILTLKSGQSIEEPIYDYAIHNRAKETTTIHPAKVIIVEGFLIFENVELRNLMDIKIFVDTDADERIIRRILRDVEERGRSLQSVITQDCETVKPMHEQFVEPTKKYADIIIPRGGMNEVAIKMLIERIKAFL
ncbi:MAG: uridine kinase, partial [Acetivibrio ethanolgignens]